MACVTEQEPPRPIKRQKIQHPRDKQDPCIPENTLQSHLSETLTILDYFNNHEVAENKCLYEAVNSCSLDTLSNISPNCRDLWESSGVPLPEVFPSQDCWSSREPTEQELFIAFLDRETWG